MKKRLILKNKAVDSFMFFTGGLPIFWAIGIILFAIRARIYLGFWPTPNHPDPKVLPFDFHDSILFFTTYAVFLSLLVIPSFKMLLFNKINLNTWHRTKLIFLSGWTLILILILVPTINFVTWYLD